MLNFIYWIVSPEGPHCVTTRKSQSTFFTARRNSCFNFGLHQGSTNIYFLGPRILFPLNPRGETLLTLLWKTNRQFFIFKNTYSEMTNYYSICSNINLSLLTRKEYIVFKSSASYKISALVEITKFFFHLDREAEAARSAALAPYAASLEGRHSLRGARR